MKRILYIAVLAALVFVPRNRLDVAKLAPVEAVAVYMDNNEVVLETDTELIGRGTTAEKALAVLKTSAPAVVYLDTARYLLIGENAQAYAEDLLKHFKTTVKTGRYQGGEVKAEAQYLDVHEEQNKPK